MFARDHTATGAMIALAILPHEPDPVTAALIAAPLALLSHFVLDILGEHDFGSVGKNALIEVAFLSVIGWIIYMAGLSGPEMAVLGVAIVAANLPDITDSRGYLTYVDRERWPHRGWWACHKPGWTKVELSAPVTILASVALTGALYAVTFI